MRMEDVTFIKSHFIILPVAGDWFVIYELSKHLFLCACYIPGTVLDAVKPQWAKAGISLRKLA